ncbi:anhydro-N-acetylmuramic acid kinase [Prochlorococcus marinus]|uniref:Anhydro-N-acetylmuramic acid kinase n=1 Tax=Prochlorococcus marinus (strain MIT 9211) TaxID=93059 RepID=ANMK_PROM4|nr:anhydro-N-acetylmuramic acid kinase [Prochlorococcus marinus]A9B9H1.1 RecName: Full=Anhydro-N-acetylmuramic acid kinase; AltName: Full=AnhMurNAc kinase [Prochlorococcus marinus str. MIT 9211]ABX08026.1 Predicted molecular chaperonemetalloprotease [Prochlorococcus marinus str. MIT 9211]
MYVLGMMSGTSADGVDTVLAEFTGNPDQPQWRIINSTSHEYPNNLKQAIIDFGQGCSFSSQQFIELSEAITEFYAMAAKSCDPKGIALIAGCHGQTVFHRPPSGAKRGSSLQILQAPLLAILIDKTVIYDFRSKDLALGGQGAPLVPLLDAALIGACTGWRAVLNLGGIANISLIPPRSGPDKTSPVLGWDCGPANTLIDLAVQQRTNHELYFDHDGLIALNGSPDFDAIEQWLNEPFFKKPPPKSTGREQFGLKDLERRMTQINRSSTKDLVSTLTIFSACVIAQDLHNLYKSKMIKPIELFIAGGGSENPVLFREIQLRCRGMRVRSIGEIGIPVKSREPLTFALLAWWHLLNKPGSSTAITGVSKGAVLGVQVHPN